MPVPPEYPRINQRIYDFCVRAFGTTKRLLKLNIKLHQDANAENDTVQHGDIFLFNHFARFETFIPQYLIHDACGAYCRSVAAAEFFDGDERFSQFLYSIGVVPNNMPNLFPFLAREILHDRKLVIFPEGGMVKDKRVVDHKGQYSVFSRTANERRKHHRGPAVIALALDAFKTALLHDYSIGKYARIERWAEQLEFDDVEHLMRKAVKPTIIVPSHITFYPIRVSDNILHQAAKLFNRNINKRFAEELIIEGNLLFKETDMDIRFSHPIVAGDYWRWWEKRLLPNAVHRFDSLDQLFRLKPDASNLSGRIHSFGMRAKSNKVRDDYMRSMYKAVTINLSHIASLLIMRLYEQGLTRIDCLRMHKMLYLGIKRLQVSEHHLHRSLLNPDEYAAIINKGSIRLDQFLKTARNLKLLHVENGEYVLDKKLLEDFQIDEVRTENLIAVYANEVRPLQRITLIIDRATRDADKLNTMAIAEYRFDDQILGYRWDWNLYQRERYREINSQQTQTADATSFLLRSPAKSAPAVLLIHGFMSTPAEMRSLGDRLHADGCHVVGIRLKGHGTSPWDLRDRNWHEWAESVTRGHDIARAFSQSVHIVGFSTGGLLALHHAATHPQLEIKTVTSVNAPIHFNNKNMVFVPLVHHANKLVSWVNSEGLVPFTPNKPENPQVNYQHIPIRALYQLQRLIDHISKDKLNIDADVYLYQGDRDPVVDPDSLETLDKLIVAENKKVISLDSDLHGVIYRNIDEVQQKICASILESV
jgi:esterase/lipase